MHCYLQFKRNNIHPSFHLILELPWELIKNNMAMSYFSHRAIAPFNKSRWNRKGVFSWIKQRCGGWRRSRTASIARCKDVLRTCRPPASGCPSAERWENTDPTCKRMLKDYLASAVNMQTDQCRRMTAAEVAVSMAMTLCCFNGLTV